MCRRQDVAKRTGREYINISEQEFRRGDHGRRHRVRRHLQVIAVDIGDNQLGAGLVQQAAEMQADMANALNGDAQALDRVLAEPRLDSGLDTVEAAECGPGRRVTAGIAGILRQSGYELGFFANVAHVIGGTADVFGRYVLAAKGVNAATKRAEQFG